MTLDTPDRRLWFPRVLALPPAVGDAGPVFLGDDILPWSVLALGGALAVGTTLALVRPRDDLTEGELERPPLGRSVLMICLGTVAAIWGLASLLAG